MGEFPYLVGSRHSCRVLLLECGSTHPHIAWLSPTLQGPPQMPPLLRAGQSLASPYPAQHQHDFSSIIPPARDILLFVPGFITTQPWLSASANTDSSVRLSLDTTSKGAPPVIAPSSHLLSLQDPTTHCAQLPPVITPVPPSHCSKIPLLTA